MSRETRQRLGSAQAELLRALLGHAPAPAGFDPRALEATAEALASKRRRGVARAWPQLLQVLGDAFAARFDTFARSTPLPSVGGPLADGHAFVRALARAEPLPDLLLRQVLAVELRFAGGAEGLRPRRGISWVRALLPASGQWLMGVRITWLGERWFSWRRPSWGRRSSRAPSLRENPSWSIQLEGRLETLERAHEAYSALGRQLASRAWRSRLRLRRWSDLPSGETAALRQAQVLEPLLDEALERVQRRARQEQWPEDHPVCARIRDLREERSWVEALANGYLRTSGDQEPYPLATALARLELLLLTPDFPLPPRPAPASSRPP